MAKLPSLYNRRLQDIAILMYKVKNKLSPLYIQDLFCSHDKGHFLRNADFQIPIFNSITYGKHSIRYFGPFLWSKLNREDRIRTNIDSFRSNIRKKDLTGLVGKDYCRGCYLCKSQLHTLSYEHTNPNPNSNILVSQQFCIHFICLA